MINPFQKQNLSYKLYRNEGNLKRCSINKASMSRDLTLISKNDMCAKLCMKTVFLQPCLPPNQCMLFTTVFIGYVFSQWKYPLLAAQTTELNWLSPLLHCNLQNESKWPQILNNNILYSPYRLSAKTTVVWTSTRNWDRGPKFFLILPTLIFVLWETVSLPANCGWLSLRNKKKKKAYPSNLA